MGAQRKGHNGQREGGGGWGVSGDTGRAALRSSVRSPQGFRARKAHAAPTAPDGTGGDPVWMPLFNREVSGGATFYLKSSFTCVILILQVFICLHRERHHTPEACA